MSRRFFPRRARDTFPRRTSGVRAWRSRAGLVAAVLIAVQALWRGVILCRGFYTQDDFRMLYLGQHSELNVDFLFQVYSGHVWPGGFLIAWATAQGRPDLWWLTAVSLLALQLVSAVVMWLILTRILGGSWARLPVLGVFLFSPLTLWSLQWWAQAIGYLPVTACLLVAVWALLVRLQDDRSSASILVVVAFVLGLSFQERALLIPLVLGGVAVAVCAERNLWVSIRNALRRLRWLWGSLVILAAGFLAMHRALTSTAVTASGARPDYGVFFEIAPDFLLRTFLPGIAGGPWRAEVVSGAQVLPATPVVVVVAVVAAVLLLVAVLRSGTGGRAALVLLGLYIAADIALLFGGRTQFEIRHGLLPRYVADTVPVATICLAFVVAGFLARRERTKVRSEGWLPRSGRLRRLALLGRRVPTPAWALSLAVTALYLASAAVSTSFLAPYQLNKDDRAFVEAVRDATADDPTLRVYDSRPPEGVMIFWFGDEQRLSVVASVLRDPPAIDVAGPYLRLFDDDGTPQPARLTFASDHPLPEGGCPVAVGEQTTRVPVDSLEVKGYVMRVDYFASTDTFITLEVDGESQTTIAEAGAGSLDFVLTDVRADHVELRLDRDATMCVTRLVTGFPETPDG